MNTNVVTKYALHRGVRALVAGAFTLLLAGTASAHGKVRVYTEVRPYYPTLVERHYGPAPVYYDDRFAHARPQWEARREWRREQWRREHWRHQHGRHHGRGHDRCRLPHWHR